MARIMDHPAFPGLIIGIRVMCTALTPQKPSAMRALMTGPSGGGFVIRQKGKPG